MTPVGQTFFTASGSDLRSDHHTVTVAHQDRLHRAGFGGVHHEFVGFDELPHGRGLAVVQPEVGRRAGGAHARADARPAVALALPLGHRTYHLTRSSCGPRTSLPFLKGTSSAGTASSSVGNRLSRELIATCNSILASGAPTQWCTPWPNAMCALFSRW